MNPLANKHILICRRPEDALYLAKSFQEQGARVSFFNPFVIVPVEGAAREEVYRILERFENYHWIILSSANGVTMFHRILQEWEAAPDRYPFPALAVVGERTARAVEAYFPEWTPAVRGMSLQQVLDQLSRASNAPQRVLQLTSEQGLQHVRVRLPEGVFLDRLAIYTTRKNDAYREAEREALRRSRYHAIIFSSPTSFYFFREIIGDAHFQSGSAIVALGPTTRRAIEETGYAVQVMPRQPTPRCLTAALEDYFRASGLNAHPKEKESPDE